MSVISADNDDLSTPPYSSTITTTDHEKASSAISPPTGSQKNHRDIVRDAIIGFSDGLTVPFALTAGLSSLGSTKLVVIGGLAELFSGAISMGLGAYLAAVTDKQHYDSEEANQRSQSVKKPAESVQEVQNIFDEYDIRQSTALQVVNDLQQDKEKYIKFVMNFGLRLEKPATLRSTVSAATMGFSYFIGGIFPMIPYFAMKQANDALFVSIGITVVILLVFGYMKSQFMNLSRKACVFGAIQTLVTGALAAGVSYGIVRAVDSTGGATG